MELLNSIKQNCGYSSVLLFMLCFMLPCQAQKFSGGTGTYEDPYLISCVADLQNIPNETSDCYALINDIEAYEPKEYITFKGNLDGRNHYVSLNIQKTYDNDFAPTRFGLFGACSGAKIKNLIVKGLCSVDMLSSNGGLNAGETWVTNKWSGYTWYLNQYFATYYTGAICGEAISTSFTNCKNQANVKAMTHSNQRSGNSSQTTDECWGSEAYVGGLVGRAVDCKFELCVNSGYVYSKFYNALYPQYSNVGVEIPKPCAIGGISGYALNCDFSNSYSNGTIENVPLTTLAMPSINIGGICGYSDNSFISCCYVSGTMSGGQNSMALICGVSGSVKAKQCFTVLKCSLPMFGCNGTFADCYTLREDDFTYSDAHSKWGAKVDVASLYMQSWYSSFMKDWEFVNNWYIPTEPVGLPLHRISPTITITGKAEYGGTVTLQSSNTYKPIEFEVSSPEDIIVEGNSITFKRAGVMSINIKQSAVEPYRPVEEMLNCKVAKIPLTITPEKQSMIYGEEPPALNVRYEGFVLGDTEESLETKPIIQCDATSKSGVGDYVIALSGASDNNYDMIYKTELLHIYPRPLIATPRNATRKYGNSNPKFVVDYEGFVNGENISLVSKAPEIVTNADKYSSVGEYLITCKGGAVYKNYTLQYGTGILTIEKSNLNIGVKDEIRNVGQSNPSFELIFEGFKNDDDKFSLDELPYAYCNANANSPAGDYVIYVEGGEDRNYNYILRNGVLSVIEATGVEEVPCDESDSETQYYTLQGVLVDKKVLTPGIYVRVSQNGTKKVLIK